MARVSKLEAAQALALGGDIKAAETLFRNLASQGERGSSAALAEIAAYGRAWEDALRQSVAVIVNPAATDTLNVYGDMIDIAGRAARETGRWSAIVDATKAALESLDEDDVETLGDRLWALHAYGVDANAALAFSAVPEPEPDAEGYRAAMEELRRKPRKFATAEDRANHLYGLASVCEFGPGAVELFDNGEPPPSIFDNVLFLAAALARAGRRDEAWGVVEQSIGLWWPVEATQIAPVALVTDRDLAPLMTPERCALVLRTPRGPDAA